MKKLLFLMLLAMFAVFSYGQPPKAKLGLPFFLEAEFAKNPKAEHLPLFEKVRYYQMTAEEAKHKPEQTRFLSNDGFEVVNVSSSWTNAQSETWMAVNPTNPMNVIATANDNAYLSGYDGWRMSSFYSKDGGKTWKHSPTPRNLGAYFTPHKTYSATIFDPAVTFDSKGDAYYAYGFTETGKTVNTEEKNGVFVVKSTNGGENWEGFSEEYPNRIVAITGDGFSSYNPFHDRYTMTADISPTSKYKDNLYIAWRVFRGVEGVVVSVSSDGGNYWEPYKKVGEGGQAPMPACGPDGEVYIAYIDMNYSTKTSSAMFVKSTNGGADFSNPIEAQKVFSIGTTDPTNGRFTLADKQKMRVSSVPQIAVDISNGPNRGTIYIIQAGREFNEAGPYGVFLSRSTDGGKTWMKNKRIDDSPVRNDRFFPSITCDPVTGIVSVFYYSSQNDPTNNEGVDGYVAISGDGGNTFTNYRVSDRTIYLKDGNTVFPQDASGGVYWGDYTSITSYGGYIYPLWWAPTNANYTFGTNDMFTALISNGPKPPANVTYESVIESKVKIKLNWVHPTQNLFGQPLNDFKINIFRDNQKIGEVAKSAAPTFTDENVEDGKTYLYKLQTESNSLFSGPVELSISAGGSPIPNPPSNISWKPSANGVLITFTTPKTMADNSPIRDEIKFRAYNAANNQALGTITSQKISSGAVVSEVLQLQTEAFYRLKFKLVAVRNGKETESEFATQELLVYSGAPKAVLSEGFDNTQSMTPIYTNANWGTTSAASQSPSNSLTDSPTGNYQNNRFDYVIIAPVVVPQTGNTLSFDHICLLDTATSYVNGVPNYDYGEISVSNDFGLNFKNIKWVNARTSDEFILGDLANSKWQNLAYSLSEYAGDTIMIRFAIGSNTVRNADGWFIDNLTLDNRPAGIEDYTLFSGLMVDVTPNPATDFMNITVGLPLASDVILELFDQLGQKVGDIDNNYYNAGIINVNYNLNNSIANGIYYIKLTANGISKTKPVIIRK